MLTFGKNENFPETITGSHDKPQEFVKLLLLLFSDFKHQIRNEVENCKAKIVSMDSHKELAPKKVSHFMRTVLFPQK